MTVRETHYLQPVRLLEGRLSWPAEVPPPVAPGYRRDRIEVAGEDDGQLTFRVIDVQEIP